jgi:uncharacterized protein YodC (DUF2158 family)
MTMIIKGYTGACLWFKRRLIRTKGFDETGVTLPSEL